ncbi:MAG: nodulation protein NfeD [Clostridia bacterium]|nr:nodulation protein NfeD [Clostridia bacterium]
MKKALAVFILSVFILFSLVLPAVSDTAKKVMVIPLEKTVEKGLSFFIARAFNEAEKENVDLIIIEIDTPGGRIDAAIEIKNVIMGSDIPTVALVKSQALSAGSYIALACDTIAMQPGSTLGDAEPRIGNERADEKTLSAWRKELATVAEANNRNPEIAQAFADRDIEIEGVIEKGKLLTLTPKEAVELGMADYEVKNREELLTKLGLENAQIISADPTSAERISRFITNPYVAPILLTIGIAGIIIEILTVGFGLFGVIGILSLILFFAGHLIAGFSGWEAVLLFVLGLIFMIIEAFSPGFGIFGIGGLLAFITSIFLVSPSFETALISLTIAIIGTIILVLLSMKFLTTRKVWKRIILGNKLVTEEGFVASRQDLKDYIGQEGTAVTILRPAGTMELDNGTRLDVVTSGEFIEKDSRIKIIKVEGNRIIVKKID